MFRRILFSRSLMVGLACSGLWAGDPSRLVAQSPATEPAVVVEEDDFDLDVQLASFDQVWKLVRERHWDPDLGGVDWDQARAELRPRVMTATNSREVRGILNELIGRLGQSHYGVIPAETYETLDGDQASPADGDLGLEMRWVDDQLVVTRVREGSSAFKAGVKPGWIAKQFGDKPTAEVVEKVRDAGEHGPARFETLVGMTASRLQQGAVGSELKAVLIDPDLQERELILTCQATPGKETKFGNFPAMRVHFDSKVLEPGVQYFAFNLFFDPVNVMPKFGEAVEAARDCDGMIIDLRGNYGGLGAMTMGMGGWFVNEPKSLGTMIMRGSDLKFALSPRAEPYTGPVAILIDECSISSAEILAGGFQDLGIARVFGTRSAGLALPSSLTRLPNGDGFQYVIAGYRSANGEELEGAGVTPDEVVSLTVEKLGQGDPVLAAAVDWIQGQSSSK